MTDEVIEMFDRCLAEAYARAGQDLEDFRKAMAQATNEKVHLFRELARAVLDPAIADPHLRRAIYQRITPTVLAPGRRQNPTALCVPWTIAISISSRRATAICGSVTPTFLETFTFHSHAGAGTVAGGGGAVATAQHDPSPHRAPGGADRLCPPEVAALRGGP